MFSEIFSFLQYIFYLINEDQYNDLKRIIGWTNTNFFLIFILGFMAFLLLLGPCFKLMKFFCWITSIIILLCFMFLLF